MLTDLYQISMAHAYFKVGRHDEDATFDLYFRNAPFSGSFAVCAGLSSIVSFLQSYHFAPSHIKYISEILPCESGFLDYLQTLNTKNVRVHALEEGTLVAPAVPMLRVAGPLALVQLLETPLLNLVNYASLVATNALRFRLAAPGVALYEFGLRRAQGPDGAMSASKYCYMGGFDGTSNVAAGQKFGIPVVGTHAHSFVQSFQSLTDLPRRDVSFARNQNREFSSSQFREQAIGLRNTLAPGSSEGELAAFIAYATVYPSAFSALVDTYSTLRSGVPNFMCVALALHECGFRARGIRLDSGDLAVLSVRVQEMMLEFGQRYSLLNREISTGWDKMVAGLKIMASNDITIERIRQIQAGENKISAYGIGTHLVTCLEQPALGCVFKLSSIGNSPRMKFSEDSTKTSLPGVKSVYRLFHTDGHSSYDLVMLESEQKPLEGESWTFRLRSNLSARITLTVHRVEALFALAWDGTSHLGIESSFEYLRTCRLRLKRQSGLFADALGKETGSDGYRLLISEGLFETIERLQLQTGGDTG